MGLKRHYTVYATAAVLLAAALNIWGNPYTNNRKEDDHEMLSPTTASDPKSITSGGMVNRNSSTIVSYDEFRICHAQKGEMGFYCEGPSYENFTNRMKMYILNKTTTTTAASASDPYYSSWGRRPYPLPKANQKVLFFGNSHLRQIFLELKCQYKDQLADRALGSTSYESKKFGFVESVAFERHITMVIVANHYLAYCEFWDTLLEAELGYQLSDFDAFVLGQFNNPSDSKHTNFEIWVRNVTAEMPSINFDKQPPPDLWAFLDKISRLKGPKRPVVYTSMWTRFNMNNFHKHKARGIKWLDGHNESVDERVSFINVRDYVNVLGECGHYYEEQCEEIMHAHRCIGKNGGHPTLGVYDVLESLYRFLS